MNVIILSSEVAPFAKTGGLADVVGALPPYLRNQGVRTSVMMPYYRQTAQGKFETVPTGKSVSVVVRDRTVTGKILEGRIRGDVPIYFIQQDAYYDRDGLYGTAKGDHPDNCERFVFFARAALEAAKVLGLEPDVFHCNDWQSALVPVYLKTTHANSPALARAATLLTIHNLAYQGLFWHLDMPLIGLDWAYFTPKYLEYYGKINLLKGGIIFSTLVSTVSKKYAEEIQTAEYGYGLEGVLADRRKDLYGVLNGVDYSEWSPEVDANIAARYNLNDLSGRKKCKADLQKTCKLALADAPVIGCIGRLTVQKGFDLVAAVIDDIMKLGVQLVILGTGEQKYHDLLTLMSKKYPGRISLNIKFDNKLAHQIEAGVDMFLMPSRYEPCGLNQLYSLKYGAVPVVRNTGGLADTITDYTPVTIGAGKANGFVFEKYDAKELLQALKRAVHAYRDKTTWNKLMLIGMKQDWSWSRSAAEYVQLYNRAVQQHAQSRK
jgi:starch synthase